MLTVDKPKKQRAARPKFAINKTFVDKTNEPGVYRDDKLEGFMLYVGKELYRGAPVKIYKMYGRVKGLLDEQGKPAMPITWTIGKHGDSDKDGNPWTADRARSEAERIRGLLKSGIDPREKQKQRQAEAMAKHQEDTREQLRATQTVAKVFDDWCTDAKDLRGSSKRVYRVTLHKQLKDWLNTPIVEITPELVRTRYDELVEAAARKGETPSSVNIAFRALRRMCNWLNSRCEDKGIEPILQRNPVRVLSTSKRWKKLKPRRDQFIKDPDLVTWIKAVNELDDPDHRDYFLFLLVTGLRKNEALNLRWLEDVDFKQGHFTARETKNHLDHTLPMTAEIRQLLERRNQVAAEHNSPYVFFGRRKRGRLPYVELYQKKICDASGLTFTPHWLRRTFSYAAVRARISEAERKLLLNHKESGDVTMEHYTPYSVDQLREPLQMVQDYLLKTAGVDRLVTSGMTKTAES